MSPTAAPFLFLKRLPFAAGLMPGPGTLIKSQSYLAAPALLPRCSFPLCGLLHHPPPTAPRPLLAVLVLWGSFSRPDLASLLGLQTCRGRLSLSSPHSQACPLSLYNFNSYSICVLPGSTLCFIPTAPSRTQTSSKRHFVIHLCVPAALNLMLAPW